MSSSFITRIEREKHEPYTVIFTTDDHDKYRHIEDECRKMIGHAKPTVDAVPVVRCRECEHGEYDDAIEDEYCYHCRYDRFSYNKADHFCSDGERKGGTSDEPIHP